jgi:hypothetical protein
MHTSTHLYPSVRWGPQVYMVGLRSGGPRASALYALGLGPIALHVRNVDRHHARPSNMQATCNTCNTRQAARDTQHVTLHDPNMRWAGSTTRSNMHAASTVNSTHSKRTRSFVPPYGHCGYPSHTLVAPRRLIVAMHGRAFARQERSRQDVRVSVRSRWAHQGGWAQRGARTLTPAACEHSGLTRSTQ